MDPLRKLVVLGTNELLSRGLIHLDGPSTADRDDDGHVLTAIAGHASVVMWSNIGFEELRISVWWKYDHSRHPQAELTGNHRERFSCSTPLASKTKYPGFVGACVSTWLERKDGKYLQGKGREHLFDTYVRKGELQNLLQIAQPVPAGYSAEGRFHL